MTRGSTWRTLAPAALALLALVLPAHAQTRERRIGVVWHEGAPDVSFSAGDFADDAVRRRLSRGLLQTIVMRTYAYAADGTTPIAVTVRSCHVVYDIWADRYAVDVRTEASDRSLTLDSITGVIDTCLVADHVVVGDAAAWRGRHGERVTFGVVVELNPVTPDMVERIRGWLARPEGGTAPDDAFFGSFVSLFVTRQIGAAEATLSFHSQELTCP
jgi:hypothetical protein